MKKRRFGTLWLFLGMLTAVSVPGLAQWPRARAWSDLGLDLTEEQLSKIQDLRLSFREQLLPLEMRWEKAALALDALTIKGAPQKEIEGASGVIEGVDREIEKAYQVHRNEVRNVLNEERKLLFDRHGGLGIGPGAGGMNPRWGMRFGPGGGFGPGPGWGRGRGARSGWGRGPGYGYGGRGTGPGRGYFCPWFRWR